MNISEYINREKEKIKGRPFKERLAYFWDYYKWYVLIGLVALIFLSYTVITNIGHKDVVLSGILVDGIAQIEQPAVVQSFCNANGINLTKEEILLTTGISLNSGLPNVVASSYQLIHARVGAADTDFIMGYEYTIQRLGYDTSHIFADLRDVLDADTLASMEEYIYYVDGAVVEQIKQQKATTEGIPLPNPQKPEEMVDPIPVAVDVSRCSEFTSVYYAPDRAVYIAVVTNSPHRELAALFVELLLT